MPFAFILPLKFDKIKNYKNDWRQSLIDELFANEAPSSFFLGPT